MRRKTIAISFTSAALVLGGLVGGELAAPRHAVSQPAAGITPKTQTPSEARVLSRAFAATAKALRPSVVRIDVETEQTRVVNNQRPQRPRNLPPDLERFFDLFGEDGVPNPNQGPGRGTGSGVVIDASGNILTNSHVVENASKVKVTFVDGREVSAKVVGNDKRTDVAVVRLDKPVSGLVAARLGDSSKLEVGEWVLAIGSPLGLDQSVTAGIVSGKGKVSRNVRMSGERNREYIQTDAKINPGNSGGPLVNLDGEVIGINTQINMGPGGAYGFAIPITHARRIAQTIMTEGRMRHAWLGILPLDVRGGARMNQNDEPEGAAAAPKGLPERAAWVAQVIPDSPAQKAGVHVGDVITRIDSQKIEGASDVIDYVSARNVGTKVTLSLLRDGRPTSQVVSLGEMVDESVVAKGTVDEDKGLQLQTLTADTARFLGVDDKTRGAVVTEVVPGSRAAKARLQAEDVIVEVDRKPVSSAEEASAALSGSGAHMVKVRRRGVVQLLTLPAR